jgi:hypothetical protein
MVYITLCSYSNDYNFCFPSHQTIAQSIGCSKCKVIDVIKDLVQKGFIKCIHDKKHCSNTYEILTVDNSTNSECHAPFVDNNSAHNTDIGEPDAPNSSECGAPIGAPGAHKQYSYNNIKSFNNIHLSISEQNEIDEIIENAQLYILHKQTDRELFEETIIRIYCAETITVHGCTQPKLTVRQRLKKLNVEIIVSAFDKFSNELPKRPINYLISLLYTEMCEYDSFNLQCERTLE